MKAHLILYPLSLFALLFLLSCTDLFLRMPEAGSMSALTNYVGVYYTSEQMNTYLLNY